MCDRNFVLIIFLILKIIVLVIAPISVIVLYKIKHQLYNFIGGLSIVFLVLLIVLKLFGNGCITNSTFSYLKNNNEDINVIEENYDTIYETVTSLEQYTGKDLKNAYYYSINYDPLKNVLLSCDKKSYMKNYGDGISAITTLISNSLDEDINEIEVISYLEDNKLIDCNNGINFDNILDKLSEKYNYSISQISSSEVNGYISEAKSVLVETINKSTEDNNFGCEKDYIVIYNGNGDEYNIINPNDKDYSYFCPSNTIGYGSIINNNQNNKSFTLEQINSKALRYFVIEVR